jgi:hypothetical protein
MTAGITTIHPDLLPGMTIEWCGNPDYLDVVSVSEPDSEGMVIIDAVQGCFQWAGDCTFTEITPALADLIGLVLVSESDRLATKTDTR